MSEIIEKMAVCIKYGNKPLITVETEEEALEILIKNLTISRVVWIDKNRFEETPKPLIKLLGEYFHEGL